MTNEQLIIIISACILVVIISLGVVIALLKKKKKKVVTQNIDQEYINNIVTYLGGKDNIQDINVDQTKLKITVLNLKIVALDSLKELTSTGVFVSGNNIKILFKYESTVLKVALDKYKGV